MSPLGLSRARGRVVLVLRQLFAFEGSNDGECPRLVRGTASSRPKWATLTKSSQDTALRDEAVAAWICCTMGPPHELGSRDIEAAIRAAESGAAA